MRVLRRIVTVLTLATVGAHADPKPALASGTESEPAAPSGFVFVHIDPPPGDSGALDPEVDLEASPRGSNKWSFVCQAPCDMPLSLDLDYRLTVPEGRPSARFSLSGSPGQHVEIKVGPPPGGSAAGIASVVVGSVATAAGIVVAIGAFFVSTFGCDEGSCPVSTEAEVAGVGTIVIGVIAIFSGAVLIHNDRIPVAQTVADLLLPEMVPRGDTALLRAPVLRDSAKDGATSATRVGAPIFSLSF